MAKKKLKKKTSAKAKPRLDDLASPVLESAQDIWRAGLGALAMAQNQSGKVAEQGAALFERLVAEGASFEKQGKAAVDEGAANVRSNLDSVRGEIEGKIEAARQQAEDRWDKLEGVFEQRVLKVIEGMGLATADDLRKLADRVEALSSSVGSKGASGKKSAGKKTSGKKAASKKTAAKKSSGKKPAAKKPAAKKPAAKKATSKKATSKKASSKKAASKKASSKKTTSKKTTSKKATSKKTTTKKAASKKTTSKKATSKKTASKK